VTRRSAGRRRLLSGVGGRVRPGTRLDRRLQPEAAFVIDGLGRLLGRSVWLLFALQRVGVGWGQPERLAQVVEKRTLLV